MLFDFESFVGGGDGNDGYRSSNAKFSASLGLWDGLMDEKEQYFRHDSFFHRKDFGGIEESVHCKSVSHRERR